MKFIFISVVVLPYLDKVGIELYGKNICIWPVVKEIVAVRNSNNYAADTTELNKVPTTKELYIKYMCQNILLPKNHIKINNNKNKNNKNNNNNNINKNYLGNLLYSKGN